MKTKKLSLKTKEEQLNQLKEILEAKENETEPEKDRLEKGRVTVLY